MGRADEAIGQLSGKYKQVCGGTFDLKQELDENVLTSIAPPSKSTLRVQSRSQGRQGVESGLDDLVRALGGHLRLGISAGQIQGFDVRTGERRTASVRQFVVNALAFQIVLGRNTGISQMLKDLRYEVSVQPLQGLEKLPVVTMALPLPLVPSPGRPAAHRDPSFRRSGLHRVIDPSAIWRIEDPLRAQVEALTQGAV